MSDHVPLPGADYQVKRSIEFDVMIRAWQQDVIQVLDQVSITMIFFITYQCPFKSLDYKTTFYDI